MRLGLVARLGAPALVAGRQRARRRGVRPSVHGSAARFTSARRTSPRLESGGRSACRGPARTSTNIAASSRLRRRHRRWSGTLLGSRAPGHRPSARHARNVDHPVHRHCRRLHDDGDPAKPDNVAESSRRTPGCRVRRGVRLRSCPYCEYRSSLEYGSAPRPFELAALCAAGCGRSGVDSDAGSVPRWRTPPIPTDTHGRPTTRGHRHWPLLRRAHQYARPRPALRDIGSGVGHCGRLRPCPDARYRRTRRWCFAGDGISHPGDEERTLILVERRFQRSADPKSPSRHSGSHS